MAPENPDSARQSMKEEPRRAENARYFCAHVCTHSRSPCPRLRVSEKSVTHSLKQTSASWFTRRRARCCLKR